MNEKNFDKAQERYEKLFNDYFPTFQFSYLSPEEMVDMIDECVEKKQNVYQLGYITLEDDVVY